MYVDCVSNAEPYNTRFKCSFPDHVSEFDREAHESCERRQVRRVE
jgi:hypothetical protein